MDTFGYYWADIIYVGAVNMKVSRLNSIEQYVISRETVSIDELCEVCVQLAGIVRRQSEMLAQDKAVETALSQAEEIMTGI